MRTTVIKAAASGSPIRYERRAAPTSLAPFEPRVGSLLVEAPTMPAMVLAQEEWAGQSRFAGSGTTSSSCDRRSSPLHPVDLIEGAPADAAQCGLWFSPRQMPPEGGTAKLLPVRVITPSHSRIMVAKLIPTRRTEDLLLGQWELIEKLGGVPPQADLGQRAGYRARQE